MEAEIYDDLPAALRAKFEAHCAKHPAVAKLWNGEPGPWQMDLSASGFEYALVGALKRSGNFTSTEFAQLHAVWDQRSTKHAGDRRAVQNAWDNNHASSDPNGFSDESGRASAPAVEWSEPVDLWSDEAEPPDIADGVLPPALERWVKDEAVRKGVDIGVMAVPAVVAYAAAIPAQFRIQVKQNDTGHTDCAVLWGAIVGAPGSRPASPRTRFDRGGFALPKFFDELNWGHSRIEDGSFTTQT